MLVRLSLLSYMLASSSAAARGGRLLRSSTSASASSPASSSSSSSDKGANAIQRIYDSLVSIPAVTFDRSVQRPGECLAIQACLAHLEGITLEDLGLTVNAVKLLKRPLCMHVHSSARFDLSVFLLPAGKSLPLHDHPGMTVVSKVVHGSLRLSAYSKITPSPDSSEPPPGKKLRSSTSASASAGTASSVTPVIVNVGKSAADPAWLLSPTEGNLHELTAESSCVIFDVLLPPYNPPERDCHFYTLQQQQQGTMRAVESAGMSDEDAVYGTSYFGYVPKTSKRR